MLYMMQDVDIYKRVTK